MLGSADPPLRPGGWRGWGGRQKLSSRCYLPHSWPVYRLQRLVSVVICLLALLLVCLLAFLVAQVSPVPQKGKIGHGRNVLHNELTNGTWVTGVRVPPAARKGFQADLGNYQPDSIDEYNASDLDDSDDLLVVSEDDYAGLETEDDYNPEFDMNYFDFSIKENEPNIKIFEGQRQQQQREEATAFRTPDVRAPWGPLPPVGLKGAAGLEVARDGVMFSPAVESKLRDPGLSDGEVGRVLGQLRSKAVTELREPSWERCGRPKNQWVELEGGVAACARYRYPDDHLLLGEVLSFYLARLLRVARVLPATLARPDQDTWAGVVPQMERAGWGAAPVVVLTPWLPDLTRDHIPPTLHNALITNTTLGVMVEEHSGRIEVEDAQSPRTSKSLREASEEELVSLLQWSDLLLFDYLTANYDRVAYMLDAAEEEGWPEVLAATVHNLVRSQSTGGLWLLDNESGLVDGYSLLYGTGDPGQAARFMSFHHRLLKSMCLFRRSTLEAVLGLSRHPRPHELLVSFAQEHEPLLHLLPDPLHHQPFVKHFQQRLVEVREWIEECVRRATTTLKERGRH